MNPELQTQTQNRKGEYTSIYISKELRKVLARIKLENDFRSYDEVIKMLLKKAGYV